jgi:hypothetical protein
MAANAESSILHFGEPKNLGVPRRPTDQSVMLYPAYAWNLFEATARRQMWNPLSHTTVNQKSYALVHQGGPQIVKSRYVVAMHAINVPLKYWGVYPTLSWLLGLLQKRTPWSVGMYLKKGGISRYS